MVRFILSVGLLLGSVLGVQQASAATVSTNVALTVTVSSTCLVSANALVFGVYDDASSTPTDSTSIVTVQCTLTTPFRVRMDKGSHGADVTHRQLLNNANASLLNYAIYRDAAHTLNWGQTDGVDTVDSTGTGVAQPFTMFGRMAANQIVPAGSYSDTVNVTVSF